MNLGDIFKKPEERKVDKIKKVIFLILEAEDISLEEVDDIHPLLSQQLSDIIDLLKCGVDFPFFRKPTLACVFCPLHEVCKHVRFGGS